MDERLSTLYLRNGLTAQQYVLSLDPSCRQIATEAILECSRLGLSIEQYGNYEQSTGTAAQESESARIVAIAKANGLFIDKSEWHKFGERKQLPSGESIVFINDREDVITKIRNPFAKSVIKGLHACDVIYEHLIHNILFPNSRYKFTDYYYQLLI